MTVNKPTIVFDFDGVIHSYVSGWKGVTEIPDPPVPGIREVIDKLHEIGYYIVIVSTRSAKSEGRIAMSEWLKEHDIYYDDIEAIKPPALVYIDDRAICFRGDTHALVAQIINFKPWTEDAEFMKKHLNIE